MESRTRDARCCRCHCAGQRTFAGELLHTRVPRARALGALRRQARGDRRLRQLGARPRRRARLRQLPAGARLASALQPHHSRAPKCCFDSLMAVFSSIRATALVRTAITLCFVQVYLVARTTNWVLPRQLFGGRPLDLITTRFFTFLRAPHLLYTLYTAAVSRNRYIVTVRVQ